MLIIKLLLYQKGGKLMIFADDHVVSHTALVLQSKRSDHPFPHMSAVFNRFSVSVIHSELRCCVCDCELNSIIIISAFCSDSIRL